MIKAKDRKRIERAINSLNSALENIKEYVPNANYYIEDSDSFLVLSGDTHDENGEARPDRVMAYFKLIGASGGGW